MEAKAATHNQTHFFNRELSWLEFNQRVLDEAHDPGHPLLERLKFFCITGSNLDEFFEVRVADLKQEIEGGTVSRSVDGRTPQETLTAVTRRVRQMVEQQFACWRNELVPALADRGIPLQLKTRMRTLLTENGRVTGLVAEQEGQVLHIGAARGVILACGGFEQSQALRERYLDQPTMASWSATPRENNTGDGLLAALEVGADTEFLNEAWWAPTLPTPSAHAPNTVRNFAMFLERGYPHSLAVNRLGKRFANEACSYHQFGQAMLRDNAATGANMPCWLVFDATFRRNYALGSLLPAQMVPDSKLPPEWLDNLLYRADTLAGLAAKLALPADALAATVARFNAGARQGVDEDFGRGGNFHNLFYGDARHTPNRTLGELITAPFYAVRLDLGDIGTKGGPKTDENARVMGTDGHAIPGLYAIGNAAGSVMGGAYPGAGATLGAAMTFGCLAAADLAQERDHASR